MPRVRDHAAEYARLKARAQAAGLSTRGFRRARKAEPEKYYTPRAKKSLVTRTLVDRIVAANKARGANATDKQLYAAARKRLAKAKPGTIAAFERQWKQTDGQVWESPSSTPGGDRIGGGIGGGNYGDDDDDGDYGETDDPGDDEYYDDYDYEDYDPWEELTYYRE